MWNIFVHFKHPTLNLFGVFTSFSRTLQKIFMEGRTGQTCLICVAHTINCPISIREALFLCKYPCIMLQAIVRPAPASRHLYAFLLQSAARRMKRCLDLSCLPTGPKLPSSKAAESRGICRNKLSQCEQPFSAELLTRPETLLSYAFFKEQMCWIKHEWARTMKREIL